MKSYLPTKCFLRLIAGVYTFVITARHGDKMRLWYSHLIKLVDKTYYHNLRLLGMVMYKSVLALFPHGDNKGGLVNTVMKECLSWRKRVRDTRITYLLNGADSFLRNEVLFSKSRNSTHFMDLECSLLYSQVPTICPYLSLSLSLLQIVIIHVNLHLLQNIYSIGCA